MVENIVVIVMVILAVAGAIAVWWIDSHGNKSSLPDETVSDKKGETRK